MLTVVDPTGRRAGVQAIVAAAALVPVALIPALDSPDLGAAAYVAIAGLLGIGQLLLSVAFCLRRDEESARMLLRASLVYLPAVLFLLTIFPWF
jgi:protoheme IX farnesyltransferase